MRRQRAYYDADRETEYSIPTNFRTAANQNELFCAMCGEVYFVDDYVFADVTKAIEENSENPFRCEDCIKEYEDSAYLH